MKEKRFAFWRWCPHPERMRVTRTRPVDRQLVPLMASVLILSLLAVQGVQFWTPSAVNTIAPNAYAAFPTIQPRAHTVVRADSPPEISSVVSTEHLTVKFTFPESVIPGETVTASASVTAKSSAKVKTLSVEIFCYADRQLVKSVAQVILNDKKVRSSDSWQSSLAVTVPMNAQRAALIGTVTEVWEETTQYYNSYYPWPWYYPPYSYPYNYTVYYVYEPAYFIENKSVQQTVPLTYVLATTPEYEALKVEHNQLEQEYDALVTRHNELSSEYDSLRSEYDQTVAKYTELQSQYNSTVQELNTYRTLTYVLVLVAAALAVGLSFLLLRNRRSVRPSLHGDGVHNTD